MKKLKKFTALFLLGITIFGCSSNPATDPAGPLFTNSNTSFQVFGQNLAARGLKTKYNYNDYEVQQYSFKMSTNGTIYSIGFQSLPSVSTKAYTIEILSGTTVLRTITDAFQPQTSFAYDTEYVPQSYYSVTPLPVIGGQVYTIRRTFHYRDCNLLNPPSPLFPLYLWNVGDTSNAGGFVSSSSAPISFPITVGNLQITGSYSYFTDPLLVTTPPNTNTDVYIPYIDFAFTPD
jgi:hypothetical protein